MNYIDKLLLLAFPFMDVGFMIFGIPFRLGELAFLLFFLRLLDINAISKITKINKSGFLILFVLLLNLILTVSVAFFSTIDEGFYYKYVVRNTLYIFAFMSFVIKPINYEQIKFESFIRYILYVVSIFYVIEFIDYYIVSFNWSDSIFVSRQEKHIFNDIMIRFAGPSSEPAYVVPLLAIPLMYGFIKRKLKYSLWSMVFILLTFSSFGYLVLVFSVLYFLNGSADKALKRKVKNGLFYAATTMAVVGLIFFKKVSIMIAYNWEKFQAYFGIGDVYEWSAAQRLGHMKLGANLFLESSWLRMIFGNGTGYYNKMSKSFTEFFLDDAEEAHNLYLSTLTDRGLIGLLLIIILFNIISNIKIPKTAPAEYKGFFIAIKFGVYVRMAHWFFTGMLWQYYFWVEVALLISASAYFIKMSNERRGDRF
ncbi:O-antigen ligase family protein [uncultured Gelidibacter sp.]|uniref:O-antigen ligase family protein n=1 Tax=uncultured Gelidibacter sp. TaxID=259318 RepID=UPI002633AC33|nr:O-antigen ligase family protein [uncultured Gelidibacter sp.]